ncbi:CRISPR-associated helicase Cas3' [Flaviflexus equikiangi]|uniref:CRISPR-associated helicase Cas3' n=1 Tax=Flaviflexus equikiangi TaxID=2758573 RepID=UPI002175230B|nr:CRISPR-associated helicase Cas3' [Flaviflexus equikiangi]
MPPFRKRFGWSERTNLRPVQDSAVHAAASVSGPTLLIIEEEMGQGKTEAALLAAEMIAARTGAGGVAFALPTMATTDAMYTRLERWASSVIEGDTQNHSLFLGHSRSRLNPEYERLIRKTRSVDSGDSSVIAHQWFSGKKGLLAEFAVTTVDQILMAALATRYVTLRHLGLSGKVVIIDEAHSYDVYTSSYLERTLSWLAAQGVSVIVLSATLASGSREKLVAAYKSGLGLHLVPGSSKAGGVDALQAKILAKKAARKQAARAAQNVDGEVPYPRLTIADHNGSRQRGIVQRGGHRKVALQFAPDDVETIIDGDGRWQSDGGVVGIVCNTVRRAQELYERLESRFGDDVELLHSQFTAADRAERELRLVKLLGPGAHRGTGRPEKRIVVGTQIIEQSLDIDFDVLISDMAPTDALIQRAGRLHRHQRPLSDRPSAFANPTLYIRGIEWEDDVPEFEAGSVAIYRERVLLGSLAVLQPFVGHEICLMHDLDSLVERTYSDALDVPLSWHDRYDAALAKETVEVLNSRQKAEQFQIKPPSSSLGSLSGALAVMLETDASRSETSASAHVRDIEPGIEVLLVMERDGYLSPLPWLIPDDIVLGESAVPPRGIAEVLASSVIRLPRWLVPPGPSIDRAIDELERNGVAAWQSDFRLKGQLLLRLNRHLEGELLGKYVRYDNEVGLRQIGEMQGTEVPADNEEGIEDSYYDDLDDGVWE